MANNPPFDYISIHAPPRGATWFLEHGNVDIAFQFTPLREGRRTSARGVRPRNRHFNSRPSARGDEHFLQSGESGTISIHAPPRGATYMMRLRKLKNNISIHAPPRGATTGVKKSPHALAFQFTPLREGRPAEEAYKAAVKHFNSRPSARGDSSES